MTRLPDPYATRRLGAGVSAEHHGARRRSTEEASRWQRGAAGERQTAALLEPLRLAGWIVLHDRSVAGATANIDHLVCDGATLWLLDSKVWRGKVSRLSDGQLWYADSPVAKRLDALVHVAESVRVACRRRDLLAELEARPLAVVAGAQVHYACERGPVEVVPQADVLNLLIRRATGTRPMPALDASITRAFPARGR